MPATLNGCLRCCGRPAGSDDRRSGAGLLDSRRTRRFSCIIHEDIALEGARLKRLLKKSEQQIPHRLKSVRDDKYKGLTTAHLKVRPFKTVCNPTFSAASEAVPLQSSLLQLPKQMDDPGKAPAYHLPAGYGNFGTALKLIMPVIVSMLRGVNVGAHNRIKMDALRALYESLGLRDPTTYVQSGNVIFRTDRRDLVALAKRIDDAIERGFGFRPAVVLRTSSELRDVIARNPFTKRSGIGPSKPWSTSSSAILEWRFATRCSSSRPTRRNCEWMAASFTSTSPMAWRGRKCRGRSLRER